ncbi:hypothetical protein ABEG10_07150 [Burkholderia cenocepacia]|uniref:hypothetical protein n=1 Tax=Burkholderia cepacia complex TaxID=87882 RepID=UPI001F39613E|nr:MULTISPECIES: hypothetical protein [Burkholderia cepacia complex]MCO8324261.1 hypothetical protein [Burkholderia cenocepacia]MCO8333192.1 hypothetical protein [Burkholderia cenocepacia]MCO8338831.1 hypothetical protein [Burkholderia cenocepacia]MCO8346117.1 hypothetical protein [Burkholderia cenocepacia]MCO8361177.1 hypothetical protein [Burkholderia cenocepacia]
MSDTTSTTPELTPQQVAADLFRIGENPKLPAWQYPVLRQAIDLLESRTVQPRGKRSSVKRPDGPGTWLWDTIMLARRAIRRSDADLAEALEARLRDRFASQARMTVDQRAAVEFALGACAGHVAGERHVPALESLLSIAQEAR